jgi:hypothetical protein
MPSPFTANCGGNATVSGGITLLGVLALLLALITGVGGLFGFLKILFAAAPDIVSALSSLLGTLSASAAAGVVAIFVAAVATAVIISTWLWETYSSLSATPAVGTFACISGVVNSVTGPEVNLFSFSHGFIYVVVKHIYWPVVTRNNPLFVWCASCENCSSTLWPSGTTSADSSLVGCSPMLPCFYRSQEVVGAALGAAIGGTIGAGVGAVLGTIAGVAAMAALGCLGAVIFAWVCWLVLLLAVIIAVLVVAVVALIGAIAGMGVGADASAGSPSDATVVELQAGAYVSVFGNLVQVTNLAAASGSNAIYFAGWIPDSTTDTVTDETQSNNNGTTIMGQSMGTPDFCFTDPDANIMNDPCAAS